MCNARSIRPQEYGTGKTHTIANIICHYLAQGKRVLVTSKGESALTEVLGKLPERVRPLSVALLSDERDGMKQFEHSIQTIASTTSTAILAPGAIPRTASMSRRHSVVPRLPDGCAPPLMGNVVT
jgi:hypothetical protein